MVLLASTNSVPFVSKDSFASVKLSLIFLTASIIEASLASSLRLRYLHNSFIFVVFEVFVIDCNMFVISATGCLFVFFLSICLLLTISSTNPPFKSSFAFIHVSAFIISDNSFSDLLVLFFRITSKDALIASSAVSCSGVKSSIFSPLLAISGS